MAVVILGINEELLIPQEFESIQPLPTEPKNVVSVKVERTEDGLLRIIDQLSAQIYLTIKKSLPCYPIHLFIKE